MSLYLTSKGSEGPQCVTVLSHKGPWRDPRGWVTVLQYCPVWDLDGTPLCDRGGEGGVRRLMANAIIFF